MVCTEGETSDSQTDSKKRRRSSAGLSGDDKKRKKISPSSMKKRMASTSSGSQTDVVKYNDTLKDENRDWFAEPHAVDHSDEDLYRHIKGTPSVEIPRPSQGIPLGAEEDDVNQEYCRTTGKGTETRLVTVDKCGNQTKLREAIVNLMETLREVYGEDVVRCTEEGEDLREEQGPGGVQCSKSQLSLGGSIGGWGGKGHTGEESLLSGIIEKAQLITAGLMRSLHNNISNNNRAERQTDADTRSDSTISSVSFDCALKSEGATAAAATKEGGGDRRRASVEVPVNNGSIDIKPSGSYMDDLHNNVTPVQQRRNEEVYFAPTSTDTTTTPPMADVTTEMNDMVINKPKKLGFFQELVNLLTEDGGCSELSSDDLSYLSSLMTQREERSHETDAHDHRQAETPHITDKAGGVCSSGEKDWANLSESASSKSCPTQSSLPKLPHKSSLSTLNPKQKPSIPHTHGGNFILAGKPAEDRGNSYWRQFRSPQPLRDQAKPADLTKSERSFTRDHISHTLPQLMRNRQDIPAHNWPKQVSKDSLVKNKIYEYYYKLGPGILRPCENPTLKIKDINFGEKSTAKKATEQFKMDVRSAASSDQSSTSLSLTRQDPCPSLASAVLPGTSRQKSTAVSTSSCGDNTSLRKGSKKIETAKEAVLNSLFQKSSAVQMSKHKLWRQSYAFLPGSVSSTSGGGATGEQRYSVYQLGSLKSQCVSRNEERGSDSRLSGPLMGKILEGYDQSCCGSKSESTAQQKPTPSTLADSFRRDLATKFGRDRSKGGKMETSSSSSAFDGHHRSNRQQLSSCSVQRTSRRNNDLTAGVKSPEFIQDRLSIGSSFLREDNNKLRREYALSKERQIKECKHKQNLLKLRFGKDKNVDEKGYKPVYKLCDRDPFTESSFEYRRASREEVRNIDTRAVSPKTNLWRTDSPNQMEKVSFITNEDHKIPKIKVEVKHIKKKTEKMEGKASVTPMNDKNHKPMYDEGLPSINKQRKERNKSINLVPYQRAKKRDQSEADLNRNSNNQCSFPSDSQNGIAKSHGTLNAQRSSQSGWLSGSRRPPYYQSDTYIHQNTDGHSDARKYLPTAAEILYFADRSHQSIQQYHMTRQTSDAGKNSGSDAIPCLWDVTRKLHTQSEPDPASQVDDSHDTAAKTLQQQYDLVGQVLNDSRKQVVVENHRGSGPSTNRAADVKNVSTAKNKEQVKPVDVKVPQWKNEKFYKDWMLQKELTKLNKLAKGKMTTNLRTKQQQSSSFPGASLYNKTYDATKYSPHNNDTGNAASAASTDTLEQDDLSEGELHSSSEQKVYPKECWMNSSVESKVHVTETLKKMLVQKVYEEHTGKAYPSTGYVKSDYVKTGHVNQEYVKTDHVNQEYVKTGNVSQEYVKPGHANQDNVKTGNVSQEYVKPGHVNQDNVKTGNVSQEYVKPGHVNQAYVKPGHVNQEYVKTGNVSQDYVKPGHVNQEYVKTGNVSQEYVKPGHVNEEYVKTDHVNQQYGKTGHGKQDVKLRHVNQEYEKTGHGKQENVKQGYVKPRYVKPGHVSQEYVKPGHVSQEYVKPGYVKTEHVNPDYVKTGHLKPDSIQKTDYGKQKVLKTTSAEEEVKEDVKLQKSVYISDNHGRCYRPGTDVLVDLPMDELPRDGKEKSKPKSECGFIGKLRSILKNRVEIKATNQKEKPEDIEALKVDETKSSDGSDLTQHTTSCETASTVEQQVTAELNKYVEAPKQEDSYDYDDILNMSIEKPSAEKLCQKNSECNTGEGGIKVSERLKKKKGCQVRQTCIIEGPSKERIKSSKTKHGYKSEKGRNAETKTKKKSDKKPPHLSVRQTISKKTAAEDSIKDTKGGGKAVIGDNGCSQKEPVGQTTEQAGVDSFKNYLQKKSKSYRLSLAALEGQQGNDDDQGNKRQPPQEVFKSVWARTRGGETPYIVNPWKPKKESNSQEMKAFDSEKYRYLLDPSMGECTTTEEDFNELYSDGHNWSCLRDQVDTKGGYKGKCIVSVSSPGHDDVHITITLPVARKQNRRKAGSGGRRGSRQKKNNSSAEKSARKVKQESDASSTDTSEDDLVRKVNYPPEVRKGWTAIEERSKQVTEHDSYQNFTTPERERKPMTNTSILCNSESSTEEIDTPQLTRSHNADDPRRASHGSHDKRELEREARRMQALAREQERIYSIIKKTSNKTPGLYMTERQGRGCTSVKRLDPRGRTSSEESAAEKCLSDTSTTGATVDSTENNKTALRDVWCDFSDTEVVRPAKPKDSPREKLTSWISTRGETSGTKYIDEVEYSITHYQSQRCYDKVTLESQCGYINLQTIKTWLPYVEGNGYLYVPVKEITALFKECIGRCNIRKSTLLKDGQLDVRMCSHHQANLFGNIWPIGKQSTNIHSGDMMVRWDRFSLHYRRLRKKIIEQHRNTTKKWSQECPYSLKQ